MRLSMWILHDWLQKYHPQPRIMHGEQTLRSARMLSGNTSIERQNVYLARASEYISGEDQKIICVHGQDMLLLNTSDMEEVLNDIFDAFDFYNSWSDGIAEEIRNGCDIQKVVDLSHDVLQQPLIVYNANNEVIAHSSAFSKGSLDREWDFLLDNKANSLDFLVNIQDLLKEQRTLYDTLKIKVPGTPYGSVYKGLFHDGVWLGRIILLEALRSLSKGGLQLFDTFCNLAGIWAAQSYKADLLQAESRIFLDLIEGRPVSQEEIDHKMLMTGWNRSDLKQLIRIEIPQQQSEITQVLASRLEKLIASSYVFTSQKVIYILINLQMIPQNPIQHSAVTPQGSMIPQGSMVPQGSLIPQEQIRQILEPVLKAAGLCAVSSYPFTDILHLADHDNQCALTCLHCPCDPGHLYSCADYALDSIHALMTAKIPGVLKHPGLIRLKQYDEDNGSDLYQTLYHYLRNNCNMAETSRQLHLHRNSLLYRLNQIKELADIHLDKPDAREHLLFSYYL